MSFKTQDKLRIDSWGLPDYILEKYKIKGVECMFPWQLECLTSGDVLDGGNLVYSAPTSAGKTLVAEILTLQTVLEKRKKVIIILPFVSVVREKMLYFQELLSGSGVRVEGFMGSNCPPGGFRAVHVAICTIEKANSLINRLLEERSFDNIGCVVVDELHLLGDPHRGYLLELLLTKIKYICKKGLSEKIQIVGMSATLPNLDLLADWLDATLYRTEFRPIPLHEYVKVNKKVYKSPECVSFHELETKFSLEKDPGDVIYLCVETILNGYSVLVFCPSKNWCETLAQQVACEIKKLGSSQNETALSLRKQLDSKEISLVLEQLKKCPAGLERSLAKSVSFGVGFHHAGLTMDERDIVEGAFRKNIIRVIVATSTLSSGVNLPARRVIVRSPLFNGRPMDVLTYKQMIGRAGRLGKDTQGESYLICSEEDKFAGIALAKADLPAVESCLGQGDLSNSLKRAILEVVASRIVTSKDEIKAYGSCTLLAKSVGIEHLNEVISSCLENLSKQGFIVGENEEIAASSLAEACFSASLPPDQGIFLSGELGRAKKCFVLDNDLHALYQVIPFSICDHWQIDWSNAFSIWESLPEETKKIAYFIGVEERFLIRAMRSSINMKEHAQKIAVLKRFYTALALQDLVNEQPLFAVAAKYGCNKGMLQSLQQSASTFAGMVTSFCRKLSWNALEVVVADLGRRIQFGVQRDLLDLMRVDCMTSVLARGLYNAGITSLPELASSSIQSVQVAIRKAVPFQNEITNAEEQKDICLPGRPGITDLAAADIFIHEARLFLLREMGVKSAEWTENSSIYEHTTLEIQKSKVNNKTANRSPIDHKSKSKMSFRENSPDLLESSMDEKVPGPNISQLASSLNDELIILGTPDENHSKVLNFSLFDKKNCLENASTPLGTPVETKNRLSIASNNSAADLFADSPKIDKIEELLKEDFDPNLGGDSIFELSILADDAASNRKRKLSLSNSENTKKPCLSKTSEFFNDDFVLDSKIENILNPKNQVSVSNTFLANAFEDSFHKMEEVYTHQIENFDSQPLKPSKAENHFQGLSSTTPKKWKRHNSGKSPSKYAAIDISITKKSPLKQELFKSKSSSELENPTKLDDSLSGIDILTEEPAEVNICQNKTMLEAFLASFETVKEAACMIKTSKNSSNEKKIGMNIVKKQTNDDKPDFVYEGHSLINVQLIWNKTAYVFDLRKSYCPCLKVLESALRMKDKTLTTFNAKEDFKLLYHCTKILIRCKVKDLSVADWLIHPKENPSELHNMFQEYLPVHEKQKINLDNSETSRLRMIWSLKPFVEKKLAENGLDSFFNDIEVPLYSCILLMEVIGLKFDREESTYLWNRVDKTMKQLENDIYRLAGHHFTITSRKDLNLMKNLLKITPANESSSEFMIKIHFWRKLSSLKARNLSQLLTLLKSDQRCRGISNVFTSTGRIVMHDPNLQHIPRDFLIDGELFSPRTSFIPNKGNLFLSADYSQLELRILAHYSRDEILLNLINSENDVFTSIASNWNNISYSQVTDDIRQQTKQIIYGIIYGMGDKTLGEHLGISAADAGMMAAKFRRSYPGVQTFLRKCVQDCMKNGFVTTIAGRKRLLPGIFSSKSAEKSQAERQAVNSTIQGSAADIAKRAMVRIEARLDETIPMRNSSLHDGPKCHLVLHLHDELLYEVSHENLVLVKQIVKHEMENSTRLSVRLPVVIKIGANWGGLKKI